MDKTVLGHRIEQRRKALGLTLEDIAIAVGLTKSTVQRYEKGFIKNPKWPVIEAIARVLDVDEAWLKCEDAPIKKEATIKSDDGPSPDDMQLLKMFHEADEQKKAAIRILLGM